MTINRLLQATFMHRRYDRTDEGCTEAKPVQTLEHVPAFIHGGPFANIAHGCNSVLATRTALHLADYVVTEAGFGADLGAEKFLDIKCRFAGLKPDAAVLVATIRALKMNGGKAKNELTESDPEAVKRGLPNLLRHMHNLKKYGLPIVVALNMFPSDTERRKRKVAFEACKEAGVPVAESTVFADGGEGGLDLVKKYWQPLIRDPITSRFMIWTFPLRKRLKPLQKKFMALTAWHLTVPLQKNWRTLKKWDTERCLSALQRHRYPSVMIRPSWEHLRIYTPCQRSQSICRRRLCRRSDWQDHDDAGTPRVRLLNVSMWMTKEILRGSSDMAAMILDGKEVAAALEKELAERLAKLKAKRYEPKLAIILAGDSKPLPCMHPSCRKLLKVMASIQAYSRKQKMSAKMSLGN